MSDMPRPPVPLSKAVIVLPEDGSMTINEDGTIENATALRHCKDPLHIFEDLPGHCQCGKQYWGDLWKEEYHS